MPLMSTSHSAGRLSMLGQGVVLPQQYSHTLQSNSAHNKHHLQQGTISYGNILVNNNIMHQKYSQMDPNQLRGANGVPKQDGVGLCLQASQTMYTNPANLQQTIWLQQQLFQESLMKNQANALQKNVNGCSQNGCRDSLQRGSSCCHNGMCLMDSNNSSDTQFGSQMEWKVRFQT